MLDQDSCNNARNVTLSYLIAYDSGKRETQVLLHFLKDINLQENKQGKHTRNMAKTLESGVKLFHISLMP